MEFAMKSFGLGSLHLTPGYQDPEFVQQVRRSVPGMAHFAATGPFGATCAGCCHFGFTEVLRNKSGDVVQSIARSNRCGKFYKLIGKAGAVIPSTTEACRHYEPKK
jgi:hypothetical protein